VDATASGGAVAIATNGPGGFACARSLLFCTVRRFGRCGEARNAPSRFSGPAASSRQAAWLAISELIHTAGQALVDAEDGGQPC